MTIDELKRALVEVHNLCATRDTCAGCPFGKKKDAYQYICYLSPRIPKTIIPRKWEVESLRKEGKAE